MGVRFLAAVLVGACSMLAGAEARAQKPNVVVLDFAGKGGDKARIQVIRALRDRRSERVYLPLRPDREVWPP